LIVSVIAHILIMSKIYIVYYFLKIKNKKIFNLEKIVRYNIPIYIYIYKKIINNFLESIIIMYIVYGFDIIVNLRKINGYLMEKAKKVKSH